MSLTVFTLPGSFAGLGFLSLYLSGKIKAFDRQGHVAKLCIVILPLLLASLVGISRVDDYRHHWEDVFVGGLIGLYLISPFLFQMYESFDAIGNQSDLIYMTGFIMAVMCYLHFFPPPYHDQGCSIFLTRQIPFPFSGLRVCPAIALLVHIFWFSLFEYGALFLFTFRLGTICILPHAGGTSSSQFK